MGVKSSINLPKNKNARWYIESAGDKKKGDDVLSGDMIYIRSRNGKSYLEVCGSGNPCTSGTGVNVNKVRRATIDSTAGISYKWQIYGDGNSRSNGDTIYENSILNIKNFWSVNTWLDVCGSTKCKSTLYDVICSERNRSGNSGKWRILTQGKKACINSEFGCCPGTTNPKEVLCQCTNAEETPEASEEKAEPILCEESNQAKIINVPGTQQTCLQWSHILTDSSAVPGAGDWTPTPGTTPPPGTQRGDGLPGNIPLIYPNQIYWNGTKCVTRAEFCSNSNSNSNSNSKQDINNLVEKCPKSMCKKTCTDSICKLIEERIFNCTLSDRDVGDPYSYYDNATDEYTRLGSRSCKTNSDCIYNEHCVNNTCLKVDANYYNTLLGGGVKRAKLDTTSGNKIMRFRTQESFSNRIDNINFKNFFFFIFFGIVITVLFFKIVRKRK